MAFLPPGQRCTYCSQIDGLGPDTSWASSCQFEDSTRRSIMKMAVYLLPRFPNIPSAAVAWLVVEALSPHQLNLPFDASIHKSLKNCHTMESCPAFEPISCLPKVRGSCPANNDNNHQSGGRRLTGSVTPTPTRATSFSSEGSLEGWNQTAPSSIPAQWLRRSINPA